MKNNTGIDYKNAVKAKYEAEKSGEFHAFLENPSPAELRELCLVKFDNGLNKTDEGIFRIYFKINETDGLRNAIHNYHVPNFKPLWLFLTGRNKSTSIRNLNMIAVLVDFNPRPYNKFLKGATDVESTNDSIIDEGIIKAPDKLIVENPLGVIFKKPRNLKKSFALVIGALLIVFSICYTAKGYILPEKQCMQWQNDHYEPVDCLDETDSVYFPAPVIPIDLRVKDFRKLPVCDTTIPFFAAGKPIVWYCKISNDSLEYFNGPGLGSHPICEKALHPITNYMINTYIKKQKP
jgi:hypothetical protein